MRLAPACGQRLSDFQPDLGAAVSGKFASDFCVAVGEMKILRGVIQNLNEDIAG